MQLNNIFKLLSVKNYMDSKKRILFFCSTTPSIMIYKIAKSLKNNDYKTILLTVCEKEIFDLTFFKNAFDKIVCSDFQFSKSTFNLKNLSKRIPSLIKFLIKAKSIKPDIVIAVGGNNWQIRLAREYFFGKFPFIYFPYDMLSQAFGNEKDALKNGTPRFELKAEKYCFENSNGIIHKGDPNELKFLENRIHKKINLPDLSLNFQPYCSDEFIVPINKKKLSKKDKKPHIVYLGFLHDDPQQKIIISEIINNITKQKIHFHIYATVDHIPKNEEKIFIENSLKLVDKNKYFHLHKALGQKEIILESSKYDFGFWDTYYRDDLNLNPQFGTGSKLASYFEAGLPLIYDDKCIIIEKITNLYGTGISFNRNNIISLKKRIKLTNYKKLEENVVKTRKVFNVDKNFPRLEKFLKEVINHKLNTNNNPFKYGISLDKNQ